MSCEIPALPAFCFLTLLSLLKDSTYPSIKLETLLKHDKVPTSVISPKEKYPLFVTWEKFDTHYDDYILRGCIGIFSKTYSLTKCLEEYTEEAAMNDPRFDPIKRSELEEIQCSTTLLDNFEVVDPLDWEIGKHGVSLHFTYKNRSYSSTFLPDVIKEQGWTKKEALTALIRKAGVRAVSDVSQLDLVKVKRYTGEKNTLTWTEFQEYMAEIKH